jgi:ornithine cyclodeaminase/alanine dehydrogenase-like protein (mu-crystallin family)
MKIAVFGCGMIAQEHIKAIRRVPGATIVGIADPGELALRTTAEKWGIQEAHTDPGTLLEKTKPDVVHVATPPDTHEALTRLALEAGCHVYVEAHHAARLRPRRSCAWPRPRTRCASDTCTTSTARCSRPRPSSSRG